MVMQECLFTGSASANIKRNYNGHKIALASSYAWHFRPPWKNSLDKKNILPTQLQETEAKCCNHILPFAFMARQVALVSNSLFLLFITYIHVRADERKRAVGGYLCASFDRN